MVDDIKAFQVAILSHDDEMVQGTALQKRITAMFSGMQNPSLLAAMSLKEAAMGAGFSVDPKKGAAIEDMHKRVAQDMR